MKKPGRTSSNALYYKKKGDFYIDMPKSNGEENILNAINYYKTALSSISIETEVSLYSQILNNLGTAYRLLNSGNPRKNPSPFD